MREAIWKKGDFFLIGGHRIDMDPSVVELPTVPIPISYKYDPFGSALGWVKEVRLEDGEITGELWILEKFDERFKEIKSSCRIGGYYTDIERNETGDRVTKAKLTAVSVVPNAAIPKEFVSEKEK